MGELRVYRLDKDNRLSDDEPLLPDRNGFVAVDEFDDWAIRSDSESGDIYIRWGDDYVPLDRRDDISAWTWPAGKRKNKDDLKRALRTAGYLHFYRRVRGRYHELSPSLYVVAGSLSEDEYVLLLDRLGELAVSERSAMRAPVQGPLPGGLGELGPWVSSPAVRQATAILEFYDVFRSQWPMILRAPAVMARRSEQRVRMDSPIARRSPLAVRRVLMRTGQSYAWLPILQEDSDTPENRFLAFALRGLAAQAIALHRSLTSCATQLEEDRQLAIDPRAGRDALRLWKQSRASAARAAEGLRALATRLQEAHDWTVSLFAHPLMNEISTDASPPRVPSLRLTRSPGYAPVYAAFSRVFGSPDAEIKLDAVRRGLAERAVRPTHELYEIWLFLEVYALLVERFGFRPAGDQPLAHLEFQQGRLKLERNHSYTLELELEKAPELVYRIQLVYEPPMQYEACRVGKRCFIDGVCQSLGCYEPASKHYSRGPDLVMEVEHGQQKLRYALDAKYRRYKTQPLFQKEAKKYDVGTSIDLDVLGTAKQKYHDGMGFDAAFVVHSDPEYNYIGDRLYPTSPHREKAAGQSLYPGHRYGAIFAVPGNTGNLVRLLKCLLMYHAEWFDICWTCRRKMLPGTAEQRLDPGRGKGTYFQCKHGHGFWVKSHCVGARHTLIKLGPASFHRTKEQDPWHCECPKCGGDLEAYSPPLPPPPPDPFWWDDDMFLEPVPW